LGCHPVAVHIYTQTIHRTIQNNRLPGKNAEKNEDLRRDWRKLYNERVRYYEGEDVKEDDVAATSHHLAAVKTRQEF